MDDAMRFRAGSVLTYLVSFWGNLAFIKFAEGSPALQKYKIQKGKTADPALVNEAWVKTVIGHAVAVPVGVHFACLHFAKKGMEMSLAREKLPSLFRVVRVLVLWHLIFDTWCPFPPPPLTITCAGGALNTTIIFPPLFCGPGFTGCIVPSIISRFCTNSTNNTIGLSPRQGLLLCLRTPSKS
jgi:hypothetical protein